MTVGGLAAPAHQGIISLATNKMDALYNGCVVFLSLILIIHQYYYFLSSNVVWKEYEYYKCKGQTKIRENFYFINFISNNIDYETNANMVQS